MNTKKFRNHLQGIGSSTSCRTYWSVRECDLLCSITPPNLHVINFYSAAITMHRTSEPSARSRAENIKISECMPKWYCHWWLLRCLFPIVFAIPLPHPYLSCCHWQNMLESGWTFPNSVMDLLHFLSFAQDKRISYIISANPTRIYCLSMKWLQTCECMHMHVFYTMCFWFLRPLHPTRIHILVECAVCLFFYFALVAFSPFSNCHQRTRTNNFLPSRKKKNVITWH